MVKKENRKAIREKKHARIRNRFSGTAQRPRLAVYRSNKHIYAQIIDDDAQKTLVSAGTVEKEIKDALENTDDIAAAEKVGIISETETVYLLDLLLTWVLPRLTCLTLWLRDDLKLL